MVSPTGENLVTLILTEPGQDWQTFATWYSVLKNLPDSKTALVVLRNREMPFQLFQWAKRLRIPLMYLNRYVKDDVANGLYMLKEWRIQNSGDHFLMLRPLAMAINPLDDILLSRFRTEKLILGEHIWWLSQPDVDGLLNKHLLEQPLLASDPLGVEARETETLNSLVSYRKGCGKWIDTSKGCPFSNAAGLVSNSMTVNENRIIELWKRMCSLYSAIT